MKRSTCLACLGTVLVATGPSCAGASSPDPNATGTASTSGMKSSGDVRRASAPERRVRFELRGKRLTVVLMRRASRSTKYAFHHARLRYGCYENLWASVGQEASPARGAARARTTDHVPRGVSRMTVELDRDISKTVGACVVESLRSSYWSDVAIGRFVPLGDFVRRDAPGPPDPAARAGERLLQPVSGRGVSMLLGERSLRVVLADEAPISVQRDFRTQPLNIACSGNTTLTRRFAKRSRQVVARFRSGIDTSEGVLCGVETKTTGTQAYGLLPEPTEP